jgi:Sigma-70, region 4
MEHDELWGKEMSELDDVPARAEDAPVIAQIADDAALPATSRKVRRRGRRTRMRSKTIAMKRLTKEELRVGALLYPTPDDVDRPRMRHDCKDMPRPCPFVSCKHHLYLDVNPETGSIKLNFPDLEVWDMKETCSLDVADKNGITLEEVGDIMNLTRERIRQVEVRGLLKLKMLSPSGDGDFDLTVKLPSDL